MHHKSVQYSHHSTNIGRVLPIAKAVRACIDLSTCHCNVQKCYVVDHRLHRLNLRRYDIRSTMPVPGQLMLQVSRSLSLRLTVDLDSESSHHACSASFTLEMRGQQ
ncbi:hypothetical protein CY34DRAFT_810270 [Suillus luteus UH-Slu-Lm8-n1]|uniref:Uncharacterized protein n=1 Tax=Suillus luteus UH-Slu-Lm8-n1 TaxID=930992 RepID=A0A0C9ZJB6_9AGAM|nr:hypothetical protein CY34DRAFT_810270 [Suillus luteus UH-Slu-Lm8-n1]